MVIALFEGLSFDLIIIREVKSVAGDAPRRGKQKPPSVGGLLRELERFCRCNPVPQLLGRVSCPVRVTIWLGGYAPDNPIKPHFFVLSTGNFNLFSVSTAPRVSGLQHAPKP